MAAQEEYERILSALDLRTQVKLAEILDVRQSSISDALKRNDPDGVPAGWKLRLLEAAGLRPEWIRTGEGPRYMVASDDGVNTAPNYGRIRPTVEELLADIGRRVPGCRLCVSIHYPEEERHDKDA